MSLLNEYERNAGDERNTYRFITRTDPTPAALKEKTLEKMRERRRENEQKAALRRKKWLRVSAAAAVLAGVVAVTPLRGYVVSAASGVCRMISSWREDVFPVDVKQSDNGCTVEIIESRVANDFLYLTVKEYYPKEQARRDGKTKQYTMPDLAYSGSIRDNKGHTIRFDSALVTCMWAVSNDHDIYRDGYEDRIITQSTESASESSGNFVVNAQYRVYLPDISSVVNSAQKKYTCTLIVDSSRMNSHLAFVFPLKNVNEVVDSKSYPLDRTFRLDGADVTFQKLAFSPSGVDLIIKVDPNADLSEDAVKDLLENLDASVYVRNDADAAARQKELEKQKDDSDKKTTGVTVSYAYLYNGILNNHGYMYDFDKDVNADSIIWGKPAYMKIGGSYYYVLSEYADRPGNCYDMEKITRSDFTVEIEYLRLRSQRKGEGVTDLLAYYHPLEEVVITAEKTGQGQYTFADHSIVLPGSYGNMDITLKSVSETKTTKLKSGKVQHTLQIDALITVSDWEGFVKDGTWETVSLVNEEGQEVLSIGLQVETMETSSGSFAPAAAKCVVVDDNRHFTLAKSDLTLYVAKVTESQTYEPEGWFNARYTNEKVDWLNKQRFFHLKAK